MWHLCGRKLEAKGSAGDVTNFYCEIHIARYCRDGNISIVVPKSVEVFPLEQQKVVGELVQIGTEAGFTEGTSKVAVAFCEADDEAKLVIFEQMLHKQHHRSVDTDTPGAKTDNDEGQVDDEVGEDGVKTYSVQAWFDKVGFSEKKITIDSEGTEVVECPFSTAEILWITATVQLVFFRRGQNEACADIRRLFNLGPGSLLGFEATCLPALGLLGLLGI